MFCPGGGKNKKEVLGGGRGGGGEGINQEEEEEESKHNFAAEATSFGFPHHPFEKKMYIGYFIRVGWG